MTDHDILIRLDEKVDDMREKLRNHLLHHFRYTLLAWSIAGSTIVALILLILKLQ